MKPVFTAIKLAKTYLKSVSIIKPLSALLLLLIPQQLLAVSNQQCFSQADSFYEQIYCEIRLEQPNVNLPSLWDFKKNNEQMQALLLKRHARRQGIDMPMPKSSKSASTLKSRSQKKRLPAIKATVKTTAATKDARAGNQNTQATSALAYFADCKLIASQLECGKGIYKLRGNQSNKTISASVFAADYKLDLPQFTGDYSSASAVQNYLIKAYERYLQKMTAIGLSGVTMSYNKFAYFFDDLHSKGVSFTGRFSTMFDYLKMDKKNNAVSTRISVPDNFSLADCYPFGQTIACDSAGSNYLFIQTR